MADTQEIVELTEENFAESINDHPFAVVDFWAPWCAPCRAFAPVFAAAAVKYPEVRFAKVNTEEQQQLARGRIPAYAGPLLRARSRSLLRAYSR
jgi:thioredoxin-like negative regulator of GroEL